LAAPLTDKLPTYPSHHRGINLVPPGEPQNLASRPPTMRVWQAVVAGRRARPEVFLTTNISERRRLRDEHAAAPCAAVQTRLRKTNHKVATRCPARRGERQAEPNKTTVRQARNGWLGVLFSCGEIPQRL